MLETISKKVSPRREQYTIEVMSCFGWKLKSSQEINIVDGNLEDQYGDIYRENYVKLVFERETAMLNYSKIVSLENKYYSILKCEPQISKSMLIGLSIAGFFASILFTLAFEALFGGFNPTGIILCLTAAPPITYYLFIHKRRKKEWENICNAHLPKILSAAYSLLS